jgi:tetratricopeptide (TPR) repeat protein
MRWSWRIARFGGTDINIHASFLLIVLYVLWLNEPANLREAGLALLLLALGFTCVVLHELGHTVVARRCGIAVQSIVLWPLGGFAMLSRQADRPRHELAIAAAGPLVNAALAAVALLIATGIGSLRPSTFQSLPGGIATLVLTSIVLDYLVAVNVALALFNLIPAYPLDGGRILRAALTMVAGEKRSNAVVTWLSWALAGGLIAYGWFERDVLLSIVGVLVFLAAGTLSPQFRAAAERGYARLFDRGLLALRQGDHDAAVAHYDRRIARSPRNAMFYNNRGYAHYCRGDHARALADYDRATELQPDLVIARANRFHLLAATDDHDRALSEIDRLVDLQPASADFRLARGYLYQQLDDDERALADYAHVIARDPRNSAALVQRGFLHLDHDAALAEADWVRARQISPKDPAVHYALGYLASQRGQFALAVSCYDRAIALAGERGIFYGQRADAHAALGDVERALADYEHALRLEPKSAHIYVQRSRVFYGQGQMARSLADCERAVELSPAKALVHGDACLARCFAGRLDWALAFYARAGELRPAEPLVYRGSGDARLVNGDLHGAVADYSRAIQIAPADGAAYLARGRAYRLLGESVAAAADFEQVLAVNASPNARRQAEKHLRELGVPVTAMA